MTGRDNQKMRESAGTAAFSWEEGAPARVVRELIRTPAFRELVKLGLREGPPGNASSLARVLLREDVDMALSALGSVPGAVNWLMEFLLETLRQLNGFPAPVLGDFAGQLAGKVDREKAQALAAEASQALQKLLREDPGTAARLREGLVGAVNASLWAASSALEMPILRAGGASPEAGGEASAIDPEAVAELLNSLCRAAAAPLSRSPGFLEEMFEHLDREALRDAADGLLEALLFTAPRVIFWLPGALKRKYGVKLYIYLLMPPGLLTAAVILRKAFKKAR